MTRRYRKRLKTQVWHYSEHNFDANSGDLMVKRNGTLVRLEESSGWGAKNAGILYPRTVKPPWPGAKAIIRNGDVWWTDEV